MVGVLPRVTSNKFHFRLGHSNWVFCPNSGQQSSVNDGSVKHKVASQRQERGKGFPPPDVSARKQGEGGRGGERGRGKRGVLELASYWSRQSFRSIC